MSPAVLGVGMRSLYDAFEDYKGRRMAILRALTTDFEKFYQLCDPNHDNLCLYGYPNGSWKVCPPSEEVPTELPEPTLGINYARDGMQRDDWLALVSIYSDSWLMSLAFFTGSRLDKQQRVELFELINRLPTCYDMISGRTNNHAWQPGLQQLPASIRQRAGVLDEEEMQMEDGEAEDGGWEDGEGEPCPQCGKLYRSGEFWIACDYCDIWYCGRCAKMTQERAETVRKWKCPSCLEKL
ncbi:unnamed protein product [Ostreobium quekettii]|uniref:Zinc finger PHD-type domain-containing protein n=1 Tax=Ostreobium quekettii TaxID=121088 RepID=A0A8S1J2B3_9CHLO|nr:unnamed protein product [Ostreobium quekettii]